VPKPDNTPRPEPPPVRPPTLPPDFPDIAQNPSSELQPPPDPSASADKVAGASPVPAEPETQGNSSKDFEERLKAALVRREARERASESALEDRTRDEGVQEKIISSAIEDWNSRILPSINRCIRRANDILGTKGFRLRSAPASLYRIVHPTRQPPSLDFPGVEITAIHQTDPIALQLGPAPSKPTGQDMAQLPRLQLGINGPHARFTVMFNYEAKRQEPMDAKEVGEEDIENTIAEFLEAVIAREAWV
jgi:hypothetical protein